MNIEHHNGAAVFRLFQLISPSLPVGGFTYSQGVEWSVEEGWITDAASLNQWVADLLASSVTFLEVPIFIRLYAAWQKVDLEQVHYWSQYLLASRETAELRQEEINRARAMTDLVCKLELSAEPYRDLLKRSQTTCYAYACSAWSIDLQAACEGFVWAWLDNLVLNATKLIPLGQTEAHKILFEQAENIPAVIAASLAIQDDDIGSSSFALAIASSQHESQYTRLFRS